MLMMRATSQALKNNAGTPYARAVLRIHLVVKGTSAVCMEVPITQET
jgi:hypothetical protein